MRYLIFFFALMMSICRAESEVIATIKPLQLLADAIADGVTNVDLLAGSSVNPHQLSLKPSDMRRLGRAKLVLWVGPDFDHYLAGSVSSLSKHTRFLAMSTGMEPQQNSHLWLDPVRARQYAVSLRDQLLMLYPLHAARIKQNYQEFVDELDHAVDVIARLLLPLREQHYFVYHDAYSHFEMRFGLQAIAVIQPNHMGPAGAKRLMQLKRQAQEFNIRCVITESQKIPREIRIIQPRTPLRVVAIDPLAREVTRGREGYIHFLTHISAGFQNCLGRSVQ